MSWLERCPDLRDEIIHICTALGTKSIVLIIQDVLISGSPRLGVLLNDQKQLLLTKVESKCLSKKLKLRKVQIPILDLAAIPD